MDRLNWHGRLVCLGGVVWREALRFVKQRERFLSALVRPLVWLFIFAAGFRSVLGVSITEPYETYVLYEVYVAPGLCAMIQLFNGMQSSLSMVYDRETGAMFVGDVGQQAREEISWDAGTTGGATTAGRSWKANGAPTTPPLAPTHPPATLPT